MASVSETIQVSGIRCEKCVLRLAKTLEGTEGLEAANANLMGQVMLTYDDGLDLPCRDRRGDGAGWVPRAAVRLIFPGIQGRW